MPWPFAFRLAQGVASVQFTAFAAQAGVVGGHIFQGKAVGHGKGSNAVLHGGFHGLHVVLQGAVQRNSDLKQRRVFGGLDAHVFSL